MGSSSRSWSGKGRIAIVLTVASALQAVHARGPGPLDPREPSCAVSDENIVAATMRQKVTLETPLCTADLEQMMQKNRPPKVSSTEANSLEGCRQAHARADQLAEQVRQLLTAALDDEQRKTAEAYYRDLFARRARSIRRFEAAFAGDAASFCTYPAY